MGQCPEELRVSPNHTLHCQRNTGHTGPHKTCPVSLAFENGTLAVPDDPPAGFFTRQDDHVPYRWTRAQERGQERLPLGRGFPRDRW